ncbi:MAG: S-layer homology domain-containing protein, partial [Clostridia bacterium]|nr:S-layer homology domain-containing protein [Clostridia bacterium]
MRILKRNLAFVLAMVMALSLTVSAKGIEDYTDANEIAFAEAVDVLTEMGILEGTDGVFNPTDILTREQGAKIIAYLMLGKSAADNLNVAEAPFTDVPANRWSAGYIAYCASQGIVKGVNANEFNP